MPIAYFVIHIPEDPFGALPMNATKPLVAGWFHFYP
jgi:hypothetical protein